MKNLSAPARVDFHLHSYASNVTNYYAANAYSIPESYSDPFALYSLLKERGMNLVTLTDHNSIDGVRLLLEAGKPDVFISSELTCRFPEDGCHIHVTVANVTEAQFAEANRLRFNVYELLAFLEREREMEATRPGTNKIAWFMTHPLMSTENRAYGREGSLTLGHLEKMFVLLHGFEIQNGSRTLALNRLTHQALESLSRSRLEEYANRHNLAPSGQAPWKKFYVAGSDDHAGINPGRTWTEFFFDGETPTPNALIEAMRRKETRTGGMHGGPVTLAHSLLKLLYDGRNRPDRKASIRPRPPSRMLQTVSSLLKMVFDEESQSVSEKLRLGARVLAHRWQSESKPIMGLPFDRVLEAEIFNLLNEDGFRASLKQLGTTDDRIFHVISTLVNRIFARYAYGLRDSGRDNLFSAIKELVTLVTSHLLVSLPYLISFLQQSSDSMVGRDVRKAFGLEQNQRVCLVTDTLFEINGVSATIKRMLREARKRGTDFTVITCLSRDDQRRYLQQAEVKEWVATGRLKLFEPVAEFGFPEYEGLKVRFPPLLEMLKYLQEEGFTKMQVSTPGSIGLTGLLAAKTLQMQTAATYHTSIPEYVENYTQDHTLEALAWKYMILFYQSVDEVLVPSRFIARLLHKRGLRNRKLLILDRWVDLERFHPLKRAEDFWEKRGLSLSPDTTRFVYVGRLGVEKNLALAAEAFRQLAERRNDVHWIIIGDGPYRKELEARVAGLPVTFTGFIEGDELPQALASCDVKLFPSTTDTWGNAPLEAQAAGLPVIVSEIGGPQELMLDGVTGLRVCGHKVDSLLSAMERLTDNAMRRRMGEAARKFTEQNRVAEPFTAVFDSELYRRRIEAADSGTPEEMPLMNQLVDLSLFSSETPLSQTRAS